MKLPESIFRNYDIRGVYPSDINEEGALHIGKAVGTFLLRRKVFNVVVGRDNRISSPSIAKNFLTGLISTGCNATYIDHTITPLIHFLTCTQNFDAGVVITASHNPANYTGFRLDLANAYPLYGKDIFDIGKIVEDEVYESGNGLLLEQDLAYLYENYFKDKFSGFSGIKAIIDTGNGSASVIAPKILTQSGCTVFCFNTDIAGGFDLGIADPENPLMMERLAKEVLASGGDVGFAFDEDADRFGAVDERGTVHSSDKLLMLFADYELEKTKGDVLFDVKSSQLLFDLIHKKGGNARMMKTGHPYFLKGMQEGALLGAEYSGHFYFNNGYFGYDDGIFAACKVLEIMKTKGQPLSKLLDVYPKSYYTDELKVPCADDVKYVLLEKITEVISSMSKGYKSFIAVDGLRVNVTSSGWFLVRASNTTPVLSIRAEGASVGEVRMLLERLAHMLEPFGLLDLSILKTPKIYYA